jgi:hypothetical protein
MPQSHGTTAVPHGNGTKPKPGSQPQAVLPARPENVTKPRPRPQILAASTLQPGNAARPTLDPQPPAEVPPQARPPGAGQKVRPRSGKGINPGLRLRALEAAGKNAPPARVPFKYRLRPNRELTRRAYWDVTAALSLLVNAILVCVLVVMAGQLKSMKATVSGLLGGLYGNFVEMDQASITTNITVEAEIPIQFDLPVSQETDVTLTRNVSIPGAYVVLNGMSVPVNFTLPSGTNLPIALNMDIPVETSVPISLNVPVNIPLNQTSLHGPFTGLQTTIQPLYCLFDQNAQYPEGIFICDGHTDPASANP